MPWTVGWPWSGIFFGEGDLSILGDSKDEHAVTASEKRILSANAIKFCELKGAHMSAT